MARYLTLFLIGCQFTPQDVATKVEHSKSAVASAAFTNEQGELICPVMGNVIATPDQAIGKANYQSVDYYFCCDSCQERFVADPEKYANGRFLANAATQGLDLGTCGPASEANENCGG